jgi:F-type H+-transporting ATPase subunit a
MSDDSDSRAEGSDASNGEESGGLATKWKVLIGVGVYLAVVVALVFVVPPALPGPPPITEFQLDPWIPICVGGTVDPVAHACIGGLDLSINKGVAFVFAACALTAGGMIYIARRMEAKPNRVQTTVEAIYDLTRNQLTLGNMDKAMGARWFPLVATLFLFIIVSNLLGYLPLPTNTLHPIHVLGIDIPALGVYAATANISVPLVLTLLVWFGYNIQGIIKKGPVAYFRGWIPAGTPDNIFAKVGLLLIESISHFVRIISLSVRLFANLLAGHLLILFMAGGLAVILGIAAVGAITLPVAIAFFIFEVVLIAGLQAFIFAILTAIYVGEATSEH